MIQEATINTVRALLEARREGHSLEGAFYTDAALFDLDIEAVFSNEWLFACNVAEIPRAGDYVTLRIGATSVVVVRGEDGGVAAFFNTCRHRGSVLCTEAHGHVKKFVCPYHQWVYDLDGSLRHARQMPDRFDRSAHGLGRVPVETLCGMVYLCLGETPPDFSRFKAAVSPYIAPHRPERTRVAWSETIVEEANWKLVIENNRECYHCAGSHPELLETLVEFALPDDPRGTQDFQALMSEKTARWEALDLPHLPASGGTEFRCIRLPLRRGALSFTMDGRAACRKLLGEFREPDLGSVRMFRVPNNWNHFLADHILHFRVLPLAPNRTALTTTWLVHEDAVEGVDYDIETLTAVWRATNAQDAALVAHNQAGVSSRGYRPGTYAPAEFMLNHFTDWYAAKLRAYLDAYGDA
ncbi:aromatic ring-hydroxylating oxygenase subunit alpha [Paraburkholderia acidisoli]|uniref:Rieske 2Fe-2S domain-containing protein n=1 Tax=Paraburkholderia acidisoli TaxID=2571748 RepID=A0A7Z2GS49_9BURK|nr:aromatic ring-hydroxylating dioxygenase subunit alpha [Paraburkholderia acidisoli]QGZ66704.1 Rieske 2Fe-2S domain-containing protein [Paraburkholderia acidisoli]